jgi:hypothetical protein
MTRFVPVQTLSIDKQVLILSGSGDISWNKPLRLTIGNLDQFLDAVTALTSKGVHRLDTPHDQLSLPQPYAAANSSPANSASACGCSEEKKAKVAEATRRFSVRAAALSAEMAAMTATSRSYRWLLRVYETAIQEERASNSAVGVTGFGGKSAASRPSASASVMALWVSMQRAEWSVSRRVVEALRACSDRAPMPGVAMPPEVQEWDLDCEELERAADIYFSVLDDLKADLRRLLPKNNSTAGAPLRGAQYIQ